MGDDRGGHTPCGGERTSTVFSFKPYEESLFGICASG